LANKVDLIGSASSSRDRIGSGLVIPTTRWSQRALPAKRYVR
jgi:hypothetical protein